MRGRLVALCMWSVVALAPAAWAEPMFLGKQYVRCTTCHISPTGGGLLSAYGRSLSHHELSITGEPMPSHEPESGRGEQAFLYGALGNRLGPVQLGINLRPSRLHYDFSGFTMNRNLLMVADVIGAVDVKGWTFYGQMGREARDTGAVFDSYEYWGGYQPDQGLGFRAGRFLPAYGIRFADHTSFNRVHLGLTQFDQIYGVEVSHSTDRFLTQVSVGPGYADGFLHDDDGRESFTATGRFQVDLSPTTALVASGMFRGESDVRGRNGAGGVAFGFVPVPRLTVWTQFDTQFEEGRDDPAYVFVNETSYEVYRGIWLKVSPQAFAGGGEQTPDLLRFEVAAVLLPRTHWNVTLSYYRDRNRTLDLTSQIFLAQLYLYL